MKIRYKLLRQDMTSHGGCRWTVGEWKETDGHGELCGPGWLHDYIHPLLAVLHNPIHANIRDPLGFAVEVAGKNLRDGQMKEGWTRMRPIKQIALPVVTIEQRVRYAILAAQEVTPKSDTQWHTWAKAWLSGADRSAAAAREAAAAAAAWEEAAASAWAAAAWAAAREAAAAAAWA
ncbi:MAG: hypothetical protein PHX05_00005, partial [Acidobacteriota bacterium]|nr:hypothetical protein [Acidobacteriota bacterium]